MNNSRTKPIVRALGRKDARIFYGIYGLALIILRSLIELGIFD